jgi:antitoxin component YwqK of YwqJK toxin-antitoxin module
MKNMIMKNLILFVLFIIHLSIVAKAQNVEGENGKTYYDNEKTKPKEVFSFKENTRFDPNDRAAKPIISRVKHGPYFYYFENGKLKVSGQYKDDKKHGEWKYYDERGTLLRSDKFDSDVLVK